MLVDKYYQAGNHSVNWDGSNYPSGSYLVKMNSGSFTDTQKIMLLK